MSTPEEPCPRCDASFRDITLGEVRVEHCDTCGVLWFDRKELETLARRPAPVSELLRAVKQSGKPIEVGFGCPRCADSHLELGTWRGIGMAMCSHCQGIAIDPASLHTLLISQARNLRNAPRQFAVESLYEEDEFEDAARAVFSGMLKLLFRVL